MLSNHCDHHCIQQFIWKWRSPDIFNQQRKRKYKKSRSDHEYIIFNAVYLWSGIDGDRNAVRKSDLVLFGASEEGLSYAYPYMMIYLIGTVPSMIATGMNPFINAQGYATSGMLSVTIGAVANLILDPLFIFGLNLGIKGAAIATIISQTLSAAYVFYFLRKKAELKVRVL